MGATASVNSTDDFLSVAPPEFVLDEFTWINILHSWETAESFSSTTYSIKLDGTSSPLLQPEEILAIIGYSWKSSEVCKPEDEEENVFQVQYFDLKKKSLIHAKCLESFLYSKYHENFTRPHNIPPNAVFTTLSFLVKTPDHKIASTELSGCVPLHDHNFFLNGPALRPSSSQSKNLNPEDVEVAQESLRKGNWNSRLKELLPGEKFDESRQNIRQTLIRVDSLLDETMKGQNLFQHKYHIYMYYKRQCQAYQHLVLEGFTTEKGERYMKEYEHWKEMVSGVIEQMMSELLNPVFDRAESLLLSLVPSTSPSFSTLATSLQTLKLSLRDGFIVDIFHLADTLDQQETVAFEHLNERFNMTPVNSLTPRTKDDSETNSTSDVMETGPKETETNTSSALVVEDGFVADPKTSGGTRRKSTRQEKKPNRRTLSPSSKLGEGRPQTAGNELSSSASNFQFPVTADAKTEKGATEKGLPERRRKSVDPSQKFPSNFGIASGAGKKRHFSVANVSNVALEPFNTPPLASDAHPTSPKSSQNTLQLPGPPLITLSASAANPLQIIKNASYQISRQKLIKRLEIKKYHQSAQQDKQLIHSIRYEIIYFVFTIVIKEAMNNYMIKEYNLLENRLLSNFTRDIEELSIIQAKELANYMHHTKEKLRKDSEDSKRENEKDQLEEPNPSGDNENDPNDHNNQNETVPDKDPILGQIESPRDGGKSQSNPHPSFNPTPFDEINDVNELRLRHDENKQKYENYLLEKRRVKRKSFEDAKNITMEKLSSKLTDIRAETENAMLSPAGLGKYKGIMKIIQLMKHNAQPIPDNN